jgi:hypothetical protein
MKESPTCWDACIASLPPEKRAAAERAFQDIAEGGPDGMFPKVFLLMEAHAAYTNTIPARITEAAERAATRLRAVVEANPASLSKEDLEPVLAAIRQTYQGGQIAAVKAKADETSIELKRLNRQVARLRYFRVGMALFLMCLAAATTAGALWYFNRQKLQIVNELERNGLELTTERTKKSLHVFIQGPVERIARVNEGPVSGVVAEFPLK